MQICKAEGELVVKINNTAVPLKRLPKQHCAALLNDMNSTSPVTTHTLNTTDLETARKFLADRATAPKTVADEWATLVFQVPAGNATVTMNGHVAGEVVVWPTAEMARAHASTLGRNAICVTALPYKLWYLGVDTITLFGEYATLEQAKQVQDSVSVILRVSGPHV